jgi:LemA protein
MLLTLVLVCAAALALLIAVPAYIAFATHNRLVALDQRCDTAFGDIDVHLKHRHNLIPPLVEMVRGFAKHESDILLGITKARAEALQAGSPEMRLTAEKNLTQNINALIGMAERYPELKASTHFSDLRRELVDAENRITASRSLLQSGSGRIFHHTAPVPRQLYRAPVQDERAHAVRSRHRARADRRAARAQVLSGRWRMLRRSRHRFAEKNMRKARIYSHFRSGGWVDPIHFDRKRL